MTTIIYQDEKNPYKKCPVFETQTFILRLVSEDDAEDLLSCYADLKAQELFNIDNFPHNCNFNTADEMLNYIKFWLLEYSQEAYIRFSIIDKSTNKAVGTIEMFGMIGKHKTETGILRIDMASKYETKHFFNEILNVCVDNFYNLFNVEFMIIKATDKAVNRIEILNEAGFQPHNFNERKHYYLRSK
jgi:RimJ/RimL family protein N-acetyltransferase